MLIARLLMAFLATRSTAVRVNGHDRAYAHLRDETALDPTVNQLTMTTASEALKRRENGTEIITTVSGQLVSWADERLKQHSSEPPLVKSSASSTSTITSITEATHKAEVTSSASHVSFVSSSASTSFSNWVDFPASGEYLTDGFGSSTTDRRAGSQDWGYVGNVGNPWGSNIIEIREDKASHYKHVVRFENENSKMWYVVVWNSYGPTGDLNGFWSPNKALGFSISPGQSIFVAIDDNSQGGWGAAEDEHLPINYVGEYASTWGEFDMSNYQNDGFSGWDVSCIIAELAHKNVSGMQICNSNGEMCSSITHGAGAVVNAYTSTDQGKKDKAVSQAAGPVRLVVQLGWSG